MVKQEVLNIDGSLALQTLNQLKELVKTLKKELADLKIGTAEYEKKSKELITTLNNLKKAQDLSKASIDHFSDSIMGMLTRLTNARRELYQMSMTDPKFDERTKEVRKLAYELNQARIKAGDFRNNIGNYPSAFAAFGAGIKGVLGSLTGFATGIGAAVAALRLFGAGIKELVTTNAQFEKSNAKLASVLGTTRSEIGELTQSARMLGGSTLYTANQVTQLQTELAKLGFTVKEIKAAQAAILDFALATGAELPEAAALAGATIRGFGLDASETEKAVNTLAFATTKSALDFGKLSTAIPIVAGVSRQMGFELEDTVSILAKLADTGMDASMAATATRNIMLFMADSSSKLTQTLGRQVHSIQEMSAAFKELSDRGIRMNELMDASTLRTVNALGVLVDATSEAAEAQGKSLMDFRKEIDKNGRALDKMANEQETTLIAKTTLMKSAWDDLLLSFGQTNGILSGVVSWMTSVINTMREMIEGIPKTADRKAETYVEEQKKSVVSVDPDGIETTLVQQWRQNFKDMLEAEGAAYDLIHSTKKEDLEALNKAADAVAEKAQTTLIGLQGQLAAVDKLIKDKADEIKVLKGQSRAEQLSNDGFGINGPATLRLRTEELVLETILKQKNELSLQIAEQENYIARRQQLVSDIETAQRKNPDPNYVPKKDRKQILAELEAQLRDELAIKLYFLKKEETSEMEFNNRAYELRKEYLTKIRDLYNKGDKAEAATWYKRDEEGWNNESAHAKEELRLKAIEIEKKYNTEIEELYEDLSLTKEDVDKRTNAITRVSLQERAALYGKDTKEYAEYIAQIHALDVKDSKQRRVEFENKQAAAKRAADFTERQLDRIRKAMYSPINAANEDARYRIGELDERKDTRLDALKAELDNCVIAEEEYNTRRLALEQEYAEAYILIEQQKEERIRRIREEQIASGAKDAIQVLENFSETIQNDTFSATMTGITDMGNTIIDTFTKMGPEMDALQKSLADIGVELTDEQKKFTSLGKLAGATFSAMGSMLSGIADAQDGSSREGFETAKKLNVAAATMSMIGGIVDALAGIPKYIDMFAFAGPAAPALGIALGTTLATTVGALGAMNIAQIESQTFEGSSSKKGATNTGALASIAAPVQYSAQVEGASTEDKIDQDKYVVSVQEINDVQQRVSVTEQEATF